jgi:hypothetical protein
MATREHADSTSSPTRLQLMGGGGKTGEPDKYSPDTPGPTAAEDLDAGGTLRGAASTWHTQY